MDGQINIQIDGKMSKQTEEKLLRYLLYSKFIGRQIDRQTFKTRQIDRELDICILYMYMWVERVELFKLEQDEPVI